MRRTFSQLVEEAKKEIQEVSVEELKERIDQGEHVTLIDVREKEEYWEGYIEGAVHLSRGTLESNIDKVVPQREAPIILYCAGGFRSALAAKSIKEMGYEKVFSMAGGFGKWKSAAYPVVKDRKLSQEQLERYSRHLLLTEVGEKGQGKLLDAKVLLVGAGGLGSPAAYYLAAAGIGTLGIVDSDDVELSNLQRQILYTTSDVGHQKALSAKKSIEELNSDVRVVPYKLRLQSHNIMEILKDYDCVLEGSDNFPTKFLVNDACVLANKPLVMAGILRFRGQVMTIIPGESACYRCIFPSPPPLDLVPSCQEAGVIGAVAGLAGLIQATEIIKIILNKGELLTNNILVLDTLPMTFRSISIRRNMVCPVCSDSGSTLELIDYELACQR